VQGSRFRSDTTSTPGLRAFLPAGEKPQLLSSPDTAFFRRGVRTLRLAASHRKWVIHPNADVERLRRAGYTGGEIGEIVANVALNLFTNDFNHVAATELDFTPAPDLAA
jgi:hypothetical protein